MVSRLFSRMGYVLVRRSESTLGLSEPRVTKETSKMSITSPVLIMLLAGTGYIMYDGVHSQKRWNELKVNMVVSVLTMLR
jgi:hypothetical protein